MPARLDDSAFSFNLWVRDRRMVCHDLYVGARGEHIHLRHVLAVTVQHMS